MAEVTWTEIKVFSLLPGGGGGAKMLVGRFQIDDGEVITTDLRDIFGVFCSFIGDVAATYHLASALSQPAAGAAITMSIGAIADYTDDTGQSFYVIIIGIQ